MSLTLNEQVKKIIKHADKHGTAAIDEEDFVDVYPLVESLMKSIKKRNKGDMLLAIGVGGTEDISDGYPEEGLGSIIGGGCGCANGTLIFLLISFDGSVCHFVENEMGQGREGAGHRAAITKKINAFKREYEKTLTAGKKAAITKKIKALEKIR